MRMIRVIFVYKMATGNLAVIRVLLQLCLVVFPVANGGQFASPRCQSIEDDYVELKDSFASTSYATVRYVDCDTGVDSIACLNGSVPCETINYAFAEKVETDTATTVSDLEVILLPGAHRLRHYLVLDYSSKFYLHGTGAEDTSVSCTVYPNVEYPSVFDNLGIANSSMFRISDITFTRCGPVSVAIYMANISSVIVDNCVFRGNAIGPILINDCDNTHIVNNLFVDNLSVQLRDEFINDTFIGLTRDLFFFSRIATSGGITLSNGATPARVLIKGCVFQNNTARPNYASEAIPERLRPLGRGGGLSFKLLGSVENHICIANCRFAANRAEISAGGATLTMGLGAANSSFTLENCVFEDNRCEVGGCVGGGLHYQTDGQETFNTQLDLLNVTMRRNSAGVGAGIAAFTFSSHSFSCYQCVFEENRSEEDGSAVSVLYFGVTQGEGNSFTCLNCEFTGNKQPRADRAAFFGYRIRLFLNGTNTFRNNTGGGISLTGGQIIANGTVNFTGNEAVEGAGVRLLSGSLFFVKSGSSVYFTANNAQQRGGAILATKPSQTTNSPTLNRRCFLNFLTINSVDIPPNEWDARVEFQGNAASVSGPSVYSSDYLDCRFVGPGVELPSATFQRSIFNTPAAFRSPFTYFYANGTQITDQDSINSQLGSDASSLTVSPDDLEARLGETTAFFVEAVDELSVATSTVFTVETNLNTEPLGTTGNSFEFVVGGDSIERSLAEKCEGTPTDRVCPHTVTERILFSLQLQPFLQERKITIGQCYPGYRYDSSTSSCMCRNDELYELLRCSGGNKEFYVSEGLWVGYSGNNTFFELRVVPLSYLSCQHLQPNLPGCLASVDHRDQQCATGRRGLLCGQCQIEEGYGVTMDLRHCSEVGCSGGGIALFVAICVFVVVFCCVILYFNIPVPNELRGFFLFAQVIGLVYRHSAIFNQLPFIDFIVNAMGNSLPFPVCMSPYLGTTWMTALGYVTPLLAFLTVIGFIIGAHYSSRLAQRSTFKGIIFIILFTYKYVTDASFILMNCVNVLDDSTPDELFWVSRFSGEACFDFPHVLWLVVALLLLVLVIVPTPVVILVITCRHFNKTKHFSDALQKGFKHRARWFTAYDLIRRVYFVFFAFWLPSIVLPVRVLSLAFFEIFMLIFHCLLRPYEKDWINLVEAVILSDLFIATVAILQPGSLYFPPGLIVLVIMLPFLYALCVTVYLIAQYIWKNMDSKWRERMTVTLGPMLHRWMKLKENLQIGSPGSPDAKTQPLTEVNCQATSKFYVNSSDQDAAPHDSDLSEGGGVVILNSGSSFPGAENLLVNQYRTELNFD